MSRLLVGCLVLTLAAVAVRGDDEKAPAKDKPKQEPAAAAYKSLMQETVKAFRSAETPQEKTKVLDKYSPKFVEFAEKHAKEPVALQALLTVVMMPSTGGKDSPKSKAIELLKKDHATSKEIAPLLRQLAMRDSEGIGEFLKAVIAKNPDKNVRAKALEAVIASRENALVGADEEKAAAIRKEIEEHRKLITDEYKGLIKDLFVGAKMPELTSKNLEGKEVKLSDLQGKVVVLDLWATWCPPCRAMIPHSRKLVERLKDKPFVLVSVSFDEEKKTVTDFLEKEKMPWTHWFNGQDGPIGKALDVQFFPTIYVLDGKGVIRFKNVREEQLDKAVDTLIKEAGK